METLITSFVACTLLAVGIALSTYLFVSVKQELCALKKKQSEESATANDAVNQLKLELGAIREAIVELDKKAGQLPRLEPPRPGMNTTRRSQVLRMHRRGERPEQIAASLGLPQGEVDLLLKVHESVKTA